MLGFVKFQNLLNFNHQKKDTLFLRETVNCPSDVIKKINR